jgi:inorganic phosphate transporter, PiT family
MMEYLLIGAVALLAAANGANDNFKGVATLWGANRTSYGRALAWATAATFAGSLAALWLAQGLVAKFSGANLVAEAVLARPEFLLAAALGGAAAVLLATWLGAPVSTTHALVGALLGSGMMAAGAGQVNFAALGAGVALPMVVSPLLAMALTVAVHPTVERIARGRDCVCLEPRPEMASLRPGIALAAVVTAVPAVRWAHVAECPADGDTARASLSGTVHWLSAAAISFARGLNDTPKIAALLLAFTAAGARVSFAMVAVAMAVGGVLGAARVARTISRRITPMAAEQGLAANLVAAGLVTAASLAALPVSTTHVTSGGIFGIGLMRRREADWKKVREVLLAWLVTLPAGMLLAVAFYLLLAR